MLSINKFFVPGAALLLTIVSGIILERSGKSLTGVLFNVHKLISLAAVVLFVMQLLKTLKTVDLQSSIILLLVLCAVCVVALIASGGLMSAGKLDIQVMRSIHRIASLVLILGLSALFYLLGWRKA